MKHRLLFFAYSLVFSNPKMGWTEEELELYPYLNNYTVPEFFKEYGMKDENLIQLILLTKNCKFTHQNQIRINLSPTADFDSLYRSLHRHMVGSKRYLFNETPRTRIDDSHSEVCSGKVFSQVPSVRLNCSQF